MNSRFSGSSSHEKIEQNDDEEPRQKESGDEKPNKSRQPMKSLRVEKGEEAAHQQVDDRFYDADDGEQTAEG